MCLLTIDDTAPRTSWGEWQIKYATSAPPSARFPISPKQGSSAAGEAADVTKYVMRSITCTAMPGAAQLTKRLDCITGIQQTEITSVLPRYSHQGDVGGRTECPAPARKRRMLYHSCSAHSCSQLLALRDEFELGQCLPASATSQPGCPALPAAEGLCCFRPPHQALQHSVGSWDPAPGLAMPRSMQPMGGASPGAAMALLAALHRIQAHGCSPIRLHQAVGRSARLKFLLQPWHELIWQIHVVASTALAA